MSTRQTIKTYKNYATGESTQEYVIKPNQASFNTITVQLFDADGDIEQEAYSENVTNDGLDYYLYAEAMQMLMNTQANIPYSFNCMVLTDYAGEEDSTDFNAYGKVIGYCPRLDTNGVGSSTTKGIHNSAESYSKFENGKYHIHLVYDWLTNTGNGTFQSIYWIPSYIDYTPFNTPDTYLGVILSKPPFWPYVGVTMVDQGFNYVCDLLGNWYQTNDDKYYKVTNPDEHIYANVAPVISPAESFYKPIETSNYFWDWTAATDPVNNSFSANHILKFNIKQYDRTGTMLDQYDVDILNSAPSLKQLVATGHVYVIRLSKYYVRPNGELIMRVYIHMNTYKELPTVAPGNVVTPNQLTEHYYFLVWDLINKTWKMLPDINNYTSYILYDKLGGEATASFELPKDKVTCFSDSRCGFKYCKNLWTDNMIVYSNSYLLNVVGSVPSYSPYIYIQDRVRCVFKGGLDGVRWLFQMPTWSAHTKLSSPVTKTTINTMKIQYDFYFDIPRPRQIGKENIIKPF